VGKNDAKRIKNRGERGQRGRGEEGKRGRHERELRLFSYSFAITLYPFPLFPRML